MYISSFSSSKFFFFFSFSFTFFEVFFLFSSFVSLSSKFFPFFLFRFLCIFFFFLLYVYVMACYAIIYKSILNAYIWNELG